MNSIANTASRLVDIEAERAVLGSCLISPSAISKIAATLTGKDFYNQAHGWIFDACQRLSDRNMPIDFVTLPAELERTKQLDEIGGHSTITDLIECTPTAAYVEHYAKSVAEKSTLRQLMAAGEAIVRAAYDAEETDAALDAAQQALLKVITGQQKRSMRHVSDVMRSVVDKMGALASGQLVGIPTGFTMIDYILGGLQKSSLYIMAGRPGMGKSALAMTMANYAAQEHGSRVAVFSLEMSAEQLGERTLSAESGIDGHQLRVGKVDDTDWTIILEAANKISATQVYFDDTPNVTVDYVRREARRMHMEHGLDLIVIDYMQLMSGGVKSTKDENRQQEISYISRNLKALARELDVPVIALSQLSRAVEARADKRPMLSDLRESGSIEQDADVVLFIYREDYYIEDTDKQNIAEVIIAKHRHGSTGTVSLFFRKELTQFRNLEIERKELN